MTAMLITYLDREINFKGVSLVSKCSIITEPLEVNSEDIWNLPEVKLLHRLLVLLAVWTVPQIILAQFFLLRKLFQAIIDRNPRRLLLVQQTPSSPLHTLGI